MKSKDLLFFLAVASVFFAVSYFTQSNLEVIKGLISSGGNWSFVAYILITVLAIVVAPLTSIPFIPLVVQVWGIFLTAIFSIIGWLIGSLIAFGIAKKFGKQIVSKMESLRRIREIAYRIPEKRMFWYLIFLRITLPVDILSYALGLFTNISWRIFFVTTLLGTIPVTILLSYIGTLSWEIQAPFIALGTIFVIGFFLFHSKKIKKT